MQPIKISKLIQGELHERLERISIFERIKKIHPVNGKATVLIGMRRVGKTFTLLNYVKELVKRGTPKESILYLNLEDDRLGIHTSTDLTKIIDQFYSDTPANHKRETFILLDEIQAISGWEKVARRLIETDACQLWLTGSSARMLSKDVATQFRGRSLAHEIWPYDFFEYLHASNISWEDPTMSIASRDLSRAQLEDFLLQGGFPETVNLSLDTRRKILSDYKDIVVLRDVIERHNVSNLVALEQLVSIVIANSGRLLSVNKLANDFKSRGIAVSKDTLFQYLLYIEDAFLAFAVPVYNRSLRAQTTSPKKIFCIDTGMVSNYAIQPRAELGHLFENLIFIDLKRQGFRIYYYVTQSGKEVDFIVVGASNHPYVVQVCFDVSDEKTLLREESSLEEAKKELNCEGILVTPDLYAQGRDWISRLSR